MAQSSEVTSGQELNSYTGNAALAGSDKLGFAPMDLSPLAVFALKKYETNKLDYEQQQKDKVALEKMYTNPDLNVFLDPALAGQIDPDMSELKELSKKHLQMNPNSQDWYRFHELYTQINKKNANAKAVQTLSDDARIKADATANVHEKERLTAYADKLKKYKLGDEIPAYDKYFAPVEEFIPTGDIAKWKVEQPSLDGRTSSIVEKSVNNPLGLLKKYDGLQLLKPESQETWMDLAHTALEDAATVGAGESVLLNNLNKATSDVYQKANEYNRSQLRGKYNKDYQEFLKANPKATFEAFLATDPSKQKELTDINDGLAFLKNPVEVVLASKDQRKMAGFTYFQDKDGNLSRLSINDKEFAAMHGATVNTLGEKETVISTKLDKTGAEMSLLDAKRNLVNEQAKTQKTIQQKNRSVAKLADAKTKVFTPAETYDEAFQGKTESYFTANGNMITRVNVKNMSTDFLKNLDIDPINQNGDINLVPANISYKGKQYTADQVNDLHKQWLGTKPSDYKEGSPDRKKAENTVERIQKFVNENGRRPDVFEFMSAQGVNYGVPEMVGIIKPVIKQIKLSKGQTYIDANGKKQTVNGDSAVETVSVLMNPKEAGKVGRSNKLQSWTNQRKDLKVTGKNLLMESDDATGNDDNTQSDF